MKNKYIKSSADYDEDIRVYMNTWANYNEYGADGVLTPAGWMDVDEAREYAEKYADYEPFINDIDDYSGGLIGGSINEYSNVLQALDIIEKYNEFDEDDRKIFAAIIDLGYDFDKAIEIVDDRDYIYYDASNPEDSGYYIIDELYNGDISSLGDDVEYYFDFDAFGRDLRLSGDVDYLFENDEGETDEEALQEFLDTHSDQEIGEYYVYDLLGGMSELGKETYENYFDYREFGETVIINDGLIELPDGGYLYIY